MYTICYNILQILIIGSENSYIMAGDSEKGGGVVSVRFPGHLYKWLTKLVEDGDYHNMSQAVIGELTKAKARIDIEQGADRRALVQFIREHPDIVFEALGGDR